MAAVEEGRKRDERVERGAEGVKREGEVEEETVEGWSVRRMDEVRSSALAGVEIIRVGSGV